MLPVKTNYLMVNISLQRREALVGGEFANMYRKWMTVIEPDQPAYLMTRLVKLTSSREIEDG